MAMSDHPRTWEGEEAQKERLEAERDRKAEEKEKSIKAQFSQPAKAPKPKRKGLIEYEFDDPEIKVGKPFKDPKTGETVKIEERQVFNAASGIVETANYYAGFAKTVKKYDSGEYDDGKYIIFRWNLLSAWQKMQAIPDMALSLATSVELESGHKVGVTVRYVGEQVTEPKPIDALLRLGVGSKGTFRLLGYIYTGRPDAKFGERKAGEIMAVVEACRAELPAYEKLKGQLKELVPTSITGLDGRIFTDLESNIQRIEDELNTVLKVIINEIDETLVRLARRGDSIPKGRDWIAVGSET